MYVYLYLCLYLYLSIHNIFMTLIFKAFNDLHNTLWNWIMFYKGGAISSQFLKTENFMVWEGTLVYFLKLPPPETLNVRVRVCVRAHAAWEERVISWISLWVTACSVFQKMLLCFPLLDPFTGLKFPQLLWVLAAEGSQMSPLLGKSLWANWGAISPRNLVRGGHSQWLTVKRYKRLALGPQEGTVQWCG